jgi:hypothetical protein
MKQTRVSHKSFFCSLLVLLGDLKRQFSPGVFHQQARLLKRAPYRHFVQTKKIDFADAAEKFLCSSCDGVPLKIKKKNGRDCSYSITFKDSFFFIED